MSGKKIFFFILSLLVTTYLILCILCWSLRTLILLVTISCPCSSETPPPEQECCYDDLDNLISGTHNGGSIKKVAPVYNRALNFQEDVRPYLLCCTGQAPDCARYYAQRPSDNGSRFNPIMPGEICSLEHVKS